MFLRILCLLRKEKMTVILRWSIMKKLNLPILTFMLSVFVFAGCEIDEEHACCHKTAYIHSGTMTDKGIKDLHRVIIMLDDGGDPLNDLMENGKGRLIRDSDGLSERITAKK